MLYDDDCDYTFHGRNTQYEFHIPAFVWYSEEYKKRYPQKIQQLQLHRTAKLSTENIFHSMLDMSDIHIPNEDLTRSIFSEKLQHHRRNVDSYGWSDYDNSTFEGGCREVKDKGTPLSRE